LKREKERESTPPTSGVLFNFFSVGVYSMDRVFGLTANLVEKGLAVASGKRGSTSLLPGEGMPVWV
jgi:hypothetical protein